MLYKHFSVLDRDQSCDPMAVLVDTENAIYGMNCTVWRMNHSPLSSNEKEQNNLLDVKEANDLQDIDEILTSKDLRHLLLHQDNEKLQFQGV